VNLGSGFLFLLNGISFLLCLFRSIALTGLFIARELEKMFYRLLFTLTPLEISNF